MFVEAKGGRLYSEEQGAGLVVILLHDGLLDNQTWKWQFETFARQFRVIRYDRRNYGKSDRPNAPFSDVEDLLALMQSLAIDKASLVGASNGGKVSLDFTLTYPALVEKLVLVGPALSGVKTSPEKNERLVQWFAPLLQNKDFERTLERIAADPYFAPAKEHNEAQIFFVEQVRAALSRMQVVPNEYQLQISPPADQRLSEIQVRMLLIIGGRDDADNQAVADKIANEVPNAQKITIVGAGHLAYLEKPQQFNQTVLDFLTNKV